MSSTSFYVLCFVAVFGGGLALAGFVWGGRRLFAPASTPGERWLGGLTIGFELIFLSVLAIAAVVARNVAALQQPP